MVDVATSLPVFSDEVLSSEVSEDMLVTASVTHTGEGVAVQLASHSSVPVALGFKSADHQAEPAMAPSVPLQDEQDLPAFDQAPRGSWQAGTGGKAIPHISSIFNDKPVIEAVTHMEQTSEQVVIAFSDHITSVKEIEQSPTDSAILVHKKVSVGSETAEVTQVEQTSEEVVTAFSDHITSVKETEQSPTDSAILVHKKVSVGSETAEVTQVEQTSEQVVTAFSDHITSVKEIEQSPTDSAILVHKKVSVGSETAEVTQVEQTSEEVVTAFSDHITSVKEIEQSPTDSAVLVHKRVSVGSETAEVTQVEQTSEEVVTAFSDHITSVKEIEQSPTDSAVLVHKRVSVGSETAEVTQVEQTSEEVVTAFSDHITSVKEIEQSPTDSAILVHKKVSVGSETAEVTQVEQTSEEVVTAFSDHITSVKEIEQSPTDSAVLVHKRVSVGSETAEVTQVEQTSEEVVTAFSDHITSVKEIEQSPTDSAILVHRRVSVGSETAEVTQVEQTSEEVVTAFSDHITSVKEIEQSPTDSAVLVHKRVSGGSETAAGPAELAPTPVEEANYPSVQVEAEATILVSETTLKSLLAHSRNSEGSTTGSERSLHIEVEIIGIEPRQEEDSAPPEAEVRLVGSGEAARALQEEDSAPPEAEEAEVRPVGSGEAAEAVLSGASVTSPGGTPSPATEGLTGPKAEPEGEAAPAPGLTEPAIATSEAGQPPPYSNTWTLYCLTDMNQPSRPSPPPAPGPFPQATLYLPNAKDLQNPPQVTSPTYVMMDDSKKAGAPPFILVGANVPEAQDWKPLPGHTVVSQSDTLKRYTTVQVPIAVPADQKFQKLPRHAQSASPPSSGQEGPRPQSPVFLSLAIPVEDVAKKCSGSGDKRTPFGSYGIAGEITLTTANVRRAEP
ncbi:calcium-binding tyrosine phosphorylation-regulated protein isoform X3 [Pipistrellus kuhlii]|uniref:calcium-binding tyrosine phosphorylation-regulated protein isoform X3 n=1 Tax=Pipistrellus kuhlii TaxID=59472 RepID=UPI001E272B23|nr:calcium-binding tyrosine phosphorylation-regulated protein isoform X3 [Pipistrellus kuhlii]